MHAQARPSTGRLVPNREGTTPRRGRGPPAPHRLRRTGVHLRGIMRIWKISTRSSDPQPSRAPVPSGRDGPSRRACSPLSIDAELTPIQHKRRGVDSVGGCEGAVQHNAYEGCVFKTFSFISVGGWRASVRQFAWGGPKLAQALDACVLRRGVAKSQPTYCV